MLESLQIEGFRKFKELNLENFGKINFILGDNNIGKTSILEAIFAWCCGQNIIPFLNIPVTHGRFTSIQNPFWILEEILATVNDRDAFPLQMSFKGTSNHVSDAFHHKIYPSELFSRFDSSYRKIINQLNPETSESTIDNQSQIASRSAFTYQNAILPDIIAKWEIKHEDKVISENITTPSTLVPHIKSFCIAKYIDLHSHTAIIDNLQIYSALKREGKLDEVTDEIHKSFPEVSDFDIIPYPDGTTAQISIKNKGGSYLPMYAYGDGIQRWFYILGSITLYKKSIICIDGIDAGFHNSAQKELSRQIIQYSIRNKVQLFMTTHNIEFIDEFLKASEELDNTVTDDIKVITLRNTEQGIKHRTMTAKHALYARINNRLELR